MLSFIGALFSGIISKALTFLRGLSWQVWAIIGGVLAALLLWHLHAGWEKSARDTAYAAGVTAQKVLTDREIAKNRINLASIDTLSKTLAEKNHESDIRAKQFADIIDKDRADTARLAALDRANSGLRASLASIRDHATANPTCKVPPDLAKALSGL